MNISNATDMAKSLVNSSAIQLNFELVGLMSAGASIRLLLKRRKKKSVPLFILPFLALLSALLYVFIDLNKFAIIESTQIQTTTLSIIQFVADSTTSICLDISYFLLLRTILTEDKLVYKDSILQSLVFVFLIMPTIYSAVDIVGITALFIPSLVETSLLMFSIFNIFLALNDVLMRIVFINYIVRVPSMKLSDNRLTLIKLTGILSIDTSFLVIGCIVYLFDAVAGGGVIYGAWLCNIFVFLQLNEIISRAMKPRIVDSDQKGSTTKSSTSK